MKKSASEIYVHMRYINGVSKKVVSVDTSDQYYIHSYYIWPHLSVTSVESSKIELPAKGIIGNTMSGKEIYLLEMYVLDCNIRYCKYFAYSKHTSTYKSNLPSTFLRFRAVILLWHLDLNIHMDFQDFADHIFIY